MITPRDVRISSTKAASDQIKSWSCPVIASEAKQSRASRSRLLRRFAPRNDRGLPQPSIHFLASEAKQSRADRARPHGIASSRAALLAVTAAFLLRKRPKSRQPDRKP